MTHITMLTQPGNTGHYFADVRVRLRLLNVADSAIMLLSRQLEQLSHSNSNFAASVYVR